MSLILVVDDNELIGRMLLEALTEHGFEVHIAMDANQGFSEAVKYIPDLIILDVQLPDVTGFDLCRVLKNRSELRSIPIIMVTGTASSTADKVKGFQMGIDDFLVKPFEMPELLERVRAVLRRSEGRRVPKMAASSQASPSTPPPVPSGVQRLAVGQAILKALVTPSTLPTRPFIPGISLAFIMGSLGLCYAALALSAGSNSPAALVGLLGLGLWGLAVSVLVMASSLVGISINWKEGAALVSLAASPILLKMSGALMTSLWTTLSPFYYSAGIPLVWESAPDSLARVDAFEIWSVYLLWSLLRRWPGSSREKAWFVTLLVWGASIALATAIGNMGIR
jgi:CheY-like chemotaxis protein